MLHAIAGCVASAAQGGNCAAGAAGGLAQSLYAGSLDGSTLTNAQKLARAELIGAAAAFFFSQGKGQNVSLGGSVARSGLENNYLKHDEATHFVEELKKCNGKPKCIERVNKEAFEASAENTMAMLRCGADADCLIKHKTAMDAVVGDEALSAELAALNKAGDIAKGVVALEQADRAHLRGSNFYGSGFAEFEASGCALNSGSNCLAAYYDHLKSQSFWQGVKDGFEAVVGSTGVGGAALGVYGCALTQSVAGCALAATEVLGGAGEVLEAGTKIALKIDGRTVEVVADGKGGFTTGTGQDTVEVFEPGANITPNSTIENYPAIGRDGTFVTEVDSIERVIGKIPDGATEIQITRQQADQLESDLGLDQGSLETTNTLSIVDDIGGRCPRCPIGDAGNDQFLGAGQGLPGGGSELVIDSIPSAGGDGIRQIKVIIE